MDADAYAVVSDEAVMDEDGCGVFGQEAYVDLGDRVADGFHTRGVPQLQRCRGEGAVGDPDLFCEAPMDAAPENVQAGNPNPLTVDSWGCRPLGTED